MNLSTHALQVLLSNNPTLARRNGHIDFVGACSPEPERRTWGSLDEVVENKDVRPDSSPEFYEVRFDVYSIRPQDWDNIRVKELQDVLVDLGFLPDDNYRILTGKVRSMKVFKTKDQKTVITLKRIK